MSIFSEPQRILAACAKGIAPFLKEELIALGCPILEERDSGVETEGSVSDAMRLNLHLRTAQRVLYQLRTFQVSTPDQLYAEVVRIPWEEYIPDNGYFTVASSVHTESIRDTRFPNMRCKDAIADRIRAKCGRRPDSGGERSGAVVFLFWHDTTAKIYLDTSGETLSRRGYRKLPMDAPMQETLAAAVIRAAGWTGTGMFINPMCGSGTLAIEAALIARNTAPGSLRDDFGFMHLRGYDRARWRGMRDEAVAVQRGKPEARIIATDHNPAVVDAARKNAHNAGVEQLIEFSVCDFAETPLPEGGGLIVINPGYGERMGQEEELLPLYSGIGDFFKQKCQGYQGYVFTGNMTLGKKVGLRTKRKIQFFNGSIECRLLGFEIYEGSKRQGRSPASDIQSDKSSQSLN